MSERPTDRIPVVDPGDAAQDHYPTEMAQCYGCGRLNTEGLHVRSGWDGDQTVAVHTPHEKYAAIPGFVYGGLVASLIDCHGTGSGALAAYRAAGRELGVDDGQEPLRFVTARLEVDYRRPTPMGVPLVLRGTPVEVTEKKVVTDITLSAVGDDGDEVCAQGRVIAVRAPRSMLGG